MSPSTDATQAVSASPSLPPGPSGPPAPRGEKGWTRRPLGETADEPDELEQLLSPTFRLAGPAEGDDDGGDVGAGRSSGSAGRFGGPWSREQRMRATTRKKARRMSEQLRLNTHISPPAARGTAPVVAVAAGRGGGGVRRDDDDDNDVDARTDSILPTSAFPPPTPDEYAPGQKKSLEGIAVRSFCLGAALAASALTAGLTLTLTASPLWRVPLFWAALAAFHFLEFWTTARANRREATTKAFLLTANWPAYAVAHAAATAECLVTGLLWPRRAWAPPVLGAVLLLLGLAAAAGGQFVRTAAMLQAGPSFNHIVQRSQRADHVLVTTGIYGHVRHPAYFGFFWWGLGTQLVLGNPVCFVAYALVLWRFFSARIRDEESFLVSFYKKDYVEYRKRVPTRIPFIP